MSGEDSDKGEEKLEPTSKALPLRTGGPEKWTDDLVKAAMSKEPIPVAPFEYAKPEEYEASLVPKRALEAYPFNRELAITQLHRELGVRRVVAIAEHAIWRTNDSISQSYFLIVPNWVWRWDLRPDDDFWETAYLLVTYPVEGYAVADYGRWIKLFNVRFFSESLATSSLAAPAAKPKDLPFPPKEEVEKFARAILHGWPLITEDDAHKKAVLWFPDNTVSRDPFRVIFRAIRGPKKRGKQPKTTY